MLLLFSISVAELPPVWERAVRLVYYFAYLCECLSFCMCAFFPSGFEGGMWDLIVLVPDH